MRDLGKYYQDGYRDGHLDRYMGRETPSIIALTWPDYSLPGYAQGYYDGYFHNPKMDERTKEDAQLPVCHD